LRRAVRRLAKLFATMNSRSATAAPTSRTPARRALRAVLNGAVVLGLLFAISPALQHAYGWWSQRQLRAAWDAASTSSISRAPKPAASSARSKTKPKAKPGAAASQARDAASAIVMTGQSNARPAAVKPWPATRLSIPEIGVDTIVVQGLDAKSLARGPGHDPRSGLPGQPGNCVIAGHRNTYGSWFYKLDQLWAGSTIDLSTGGQTFRYQVISVSTVAESDSSVLKASPGAPPMLTLYTCTLPHSPFRIVATAFLQGS
jgi:LPXTG-site transpeptidase (sortase) family protein